MLCYCMLCYCALSLSLSLSLSLPPPVEFTSRRAPVGEATLGLGGAHRQAAVEQVGQVPVALAHQGVVEGDVRPVVLPQQQLQQSRGLVLPGGLRGGRSSEFMCNNAFDIMTGSQCLQISFRDVKPVYYFLLLQLYLNVPCLLLLHVYF